MIVKLLIGIMVVLSVVLLVGVAQVVLREPANIRTKDGFQSDAEMRIALDRLKQLEQDAEQPTAPSASPLPNLSPEDTIRPLEEVARLLEVPWDIAFLPNKSMLIAERPGRIILLDDVGNRAIVYSENVVRRGEAGLLGMVLHPNFPNNRFVYLYRTVTEGAATVNRVDRYVFTGTSFSSRATIIENIPGSMYHDGGRLEFGPDRKLYIATGDAGNEELAQATSSLAGKILRLNDDGSIPVDNPISGSPVYSLGHRNPQGMAWDTRGNMYASEHGPSLPTFCCRDEINIIQPGKNYGWPLISGEETREGMETPLIHSGTFTTWAPASLAYVAGSLFFGGLRGETLYEVRFEQDGPVLYEHFKNQYGRIRTVRVGPDGLLYFMTSNRDGRGNPKVGDDRIFRVDPRSFRLATP